MYSSDLRIRVDETGLFRSPYLSVICGGIHYRGGETDTALNPRLIVEVRFGEPTGPEVHRGNPPLSEVYDGVVFPAELTETDAARSKAPT